MLVTLSVWRSPCSFSLTRGSLREVMRAGCEIVVLMVDYCITGLLRIIIKLGEPGGVSPQGDRILSMAVRHQPVTRVISVTLVANAPRPASGARQPTVADV